MTSLLYKRKRQHLYIAINLFSSVGSLSGIYLTSDPAECHGLLYLRYPTGTNIYALIIYRIYLLRRGPHNRGYRSSPSQDSGSRYSTRVYRQSYLGYGSSCAAWLHKLGSWSTTHIPVPSWSLTTNHHSRLQLASTYILQHQCNAKHLEWRWNFEEIEIKQIYSSSTQHGKQTEWKWSWATSDPEITSKL